MADVINDGTPIGATNFVFDIVSSGGESVGHTGSQIKKHIHTCQAVDVCLDRIIDDP